MSRYGYDSDFEQGRRDFEYRHRPDMERDRFASFDQPDRDYFDGFREAERQAEEREEERRAEEREEERRHNDRRRQTEYEEEAAFEEEQRRAEEEAAEMEQSEPETAEKE